MKKRILSTICVILLFAALVLLFSCTAVGASGIPEPRGRGIELYNTVDIEDGGVELLYTGDGVDPLSYNTYCVQLLLSDYSILNRNEIDDRIYTTFVNRKSGDSLYVAYNPATSIEEQAEEGREPVKKSAPAMRIVSSKTKGGALSSADILSPKSGYEKKTDPIITAVPLYLHATGLSYVITLEDGSFIVLDGGGISRGATEHTQLFDILSELHTQVNGAPPSTESPIRIAAWILSHNHWDHYYCFELMLEEYGQSGLIELEYMLANLPNKSAVTENISDLHYMDSELIASLSEAVGGFEFVRVHTGQKYYFAGVEMEILMTWEDLDPSTVTKTNNTCTVARFSFGSSSRKDRTTMLWLADAEMVESDYLTEHCGEYLKSDIVTIAHHGNEGCSSLLYDLVDPTAVLWPNHGRAVCNYLDPKNRPLGGKYEVDQHLVYDIDSVLYIVMSGDKSSNPEDYRSSCTCLIIGKDGPEYDGIYNLYSGELAKYCTIAEFIENGYYETVLTK